MPEVSVKKGEPVDKALKRLKSILDSEGIMDEIRRLRAYETPTERTRRKARAAAKRGRIKFRYVNEEKKAQLQAKYDAEQAAKGDAPAADTGSDNTSAND